MFEILDGLEECLHEKDDAVLAMVVDAAGSVYRREGAKTLLRSDGRMIGTISGGCLDSDIRERALEVRRDRRPRLVRYDTRAMSDEVFGLGVGCGGEVEIWLESLDWWQTTEGRAVRAALRDAIDEGEAIVLKTVLRREGTVVDGVERELSPKSEASRSRIVRDGAEEIFVDRVTPPPRMIVLGSGADVEPLVTIAGDAGFQVTLATEGPEVDPRRFPGRRIVPAPGGRFAEIDLRGRPAIVLMTHKTAVDREALRSLLPEVSRLSYLGVLGPRSRTVKLLSELDTDGVHVPPSILDVLHGPAGLDLGSESPGEIALSIVSEALAVRNGRAAGRLRDKSPPVDPHPRGT